MPVEWEDDDEPLGGRPDEETDGEGEEDDDDDEGEWIVDPANPGYEIFVRDEDEEE